MVINLFQLPNCKKQLIGKFNVVDHSLNWKSILLCKKSRDCLRLGPPAEGEVVQVKWPDGKLYCAKYLGTNTAHMYQVSVCIYYHVLVFQMSLLQITLLTLSLDRPPEPSKLQNCEVWALILTVNTLILINKLSKPLTSIVHSLRVKISPVLTKSRKWLI